MSSTSKQILEAQKLQEQIDKGEHPVPQQRSSVSGASAEQLTTKTQAGIPEGADLEAKVPGMYKETAPVVEEKLSSEPVEAREIAKVVGKDQEHQLKEYMGEPTTAAQEKTAVEELELTPAEKQTRITDEQAQAEGDVAKTKAGIAIDDDETPAAKQTKVTEKQKKFGDTEETTTTVEEVPAADDTSSSSSDSGDDTLQAHHPKDEAGKKVAEKKQVKETKEKK